MLFLEQNIELNDTELEIYNYITANLNQVVYMRIRDLADETHVSTTTILRFCRKFKCNGFSEFRVKLKLYAEKQRRIAIDMSDETTYIDFFKKGQPGMSSKANFKRQLQSFGNPSWSCSRELVPQVLLLNMEPFIFPHYLLLHFISKIRLITRFTIFQVNYLIKFVL